MAESEVISSCLTSDQDNRFMYILKEQRETIWWTLFDTKGVPCEEREHRIFVEEGSRSSRENQRHKNVLMLEVLKNKIIKWLKCNIFYPISNSSWASLVHLVPKKLALPYNRMIKVKKGNLD